MQTRVKHIQAIKKEIPKCFHRSKFFFQKFYELNQKKTDEK
jgi:hypothetical protein